MIDFDKISGLLKYLGFDMKGLGRWFCISFDEKEGKVTWLVANYQTLIKNRGIESLYHNHSRYLPPKDIKDCHRM